MTHCEMALYILCSAIAVISIYVAIMMYLIEEDRKRKIEAKRERKRGSGGNRGNNAVRSAKRPRTVNQ